MDISSDENWMKKALSQAYDGADQGEIPVGAIAVDSNNSVLGRAHNQVEMLKDATAHAEMIVLTQASSAMGDWRLTEVTVYVTKEPCAMCAGAMVNTRLGRLVFGCADPKCGAAGSAINLLDFPGMLHQVPVTSGVFEEDCIEILQNFFQVRRSSKNKDNHRVEGQNPD